jgi:hypothetical protein
VWSSNNISVIHYGGLTLGKIRKAFVSFKVMRSVESNILFISKHYGLKRTILILFSMYRWSLAELYRRKISTAISIFIGIILGIKDTIVVKSVEREYL